MRIAVVSDIHGNRTAFEAVLADLRQVSPDLIFHGGDLADGGASPAEIVDRVRDLGWPGVVGNTDEMLFRPEALKEFAEQSGGFRPLLPFIEAMAAESRELLGEERLTWLQNLPRVQIRNPIALVHASPQTIWRAPAPEASDAELQTVYCALGQPIAIYAHIHRSFIRNCPELIVANTGSVSLSYDDDRRASYLLVEDAKPSIRRVEYDVDRELKALSLSGLPHADWIARILETARPQMP